MPRNMTDAKALTKAIELLTWAADYHSPFLNWQRDMYREARAVLSARLDEELEYERTNRHEHERAKGSYDPADESVDFLPNSPVKDPLILEFLLDHPNLDDKTKTAIREQWIGNCDSAASAAGDALPPPSPAVGAGEDEE